MARLSTTERIVGLAQSVDWLKQSPDPLVQEFGRTLSAWMGDPKTMTLDSKLKGGRRGGVSLGRAVALVDRDLSLRMLASCRPEWQGLNAPAIAALMLVSFRRYETSRWPREQHQSDAPAAEPAATWWRTLRSGLRLPARKRLTQILRAGVEP